MRRLPSIALETLSAPKTPTPAALRRLLGGLLAGLSLCACPSPVAAADAGPLETALTTALWTWGAVGEIRFGADQRGSTSDGAAFCWEVVRPQVVRLTQLAAATGAKTDHEAVLVLDESDNQFTGTSFDGVKIAGVRETPADDQIDASVPALGQTDAMNALLTHSWSWAVDGASADPNLEFEFQPTGILLSSTGQMWSWRWAGLRRVMIMGTTEQVAYLDFDRRFLGFTTAGFAGGHKIRGAQRLVIVPGAHLSLPGAGKRASVVQAAPGPLLAQNLRQTGNAAAPAPKAPARPAPQPAPQRVAAPRAPASHAAPRPAPRPAPMIRRAR